MTTGEADLGVVDAAIAGLVAHITEVLADADVQVVDGPPTVDVRDDLVAVGVNLAGAGAAGTARPGYGGRVRVAFDLGCEIDAWSGGSDMRPLRTRVLAIVAAIRTSLVADPTAGGVCVRAVLTRWTCQLDVGQQGAQARSDVVISVELDEFV